MKGFGLIKESLVATGMMVLIAFGISFIPIKFEFTKGIRQGFLGFDIYDLYFSGKNLNNTYRDTNIVIIEIADNRGDIADQIGLIQKYSPAAIGVDAVFEKEKDLRDDIRLIQLLNDSRNIVLASKYDKDPSTGKEGFINDFFVTKEKSIPIGYANFIGSRHSVIRTYPPFMKIGDSLYLSFTAALAKYTRPEEFKKLKRRGNALEVINYSGNVENFTCLSKEQLIEADTSGQLSVLVPGKIVLLGYIDKDLPLTLEDLHFSPLNEEIAGKSFPDIYGVMVHANILSMIIRGKYINQAPGFISYLFAFIITFMFLLFILSRYKVHKHPKHGWLLVLQFLLILLVLFIFLKVFDLFWYKVPLLPIMITLVLSVEFFGLYIILAQWLNKRFHYKTLFPHKKK